MKIRGIVLFLFCFSLTLNGADKLQKIIVSKDNKGFETEDGKSFIPWGINYFRPETGWPPQFWKMYDPQLVRKDFAILKKMNVNCIRVFLTYNEFLPLPNEVNERGLKKLDDFLKIAEEYGIYVHLTGPELWEGTPEWAKGDRFNDDNVLKALDIFWSTIAARYRNHNVLFAYDLMNEPSIPWNSPEMKKKWDNWIINKYGDLDAASKNWGVDVMILKKYSVPTYDSKYLKWLRDYQEFREEIAVNWVNRQVKVIKQAAPSALVTVGLIQWSIPLFLSNISMYSAFRPSKIAPYLDFMEIHFYPLAGGVYTYQSLDAELKNLAYAEAIASEVYRNNKPVVLAEYGWYGGGNLPGTNDPIASEEQQSRWCKRLVETTMGWVCGWLHWGMYDHPSALDVTRYIGLFRTNGEIKEWGKTFKMIGKDFRRNKYIKSPQKFFPKFPFDDAIVDISVGNSYFNVFFEQFISSQE